MTIDENYMERLANAVAKTILDAIENLSIEDVNMYQIGYNKAIDDLCNEFRKDWVEQCENDMEDCINWYDWLIASAKHLKGEQNNE